MRKQMKVKIRGQKWDLCLQRRLKGYDGWCDYEKKKILIAKHLSGQELLDTIIHEVMHAAFYDIAEHGVAEAATDLTTILTQLGYRLVEV